MCVCVCVCVCVYVCVCVCERERERERERRHKLMHEERDSEGEILRKTLSRREGAGTGRQGDLSERGEAAEDEDHVEPVPRVAREGFEPALARQPAAMILRAGWRRECAKARVVSRHGRAKSASVSALALRRCPGFRAVRLCVRPSVHSCPHIGVSRSVGWGVRSDDR